MPKCPRCNQSASTVVQCDRCGDTRCNSGISGKGCGSLGQAGNIGALCKVCNKGHYKKI